MPSNSEADHDDTGLDGPEDRAESAVERSSGNSPGKNRPTRRRLLAASAGILAGLAGCSDQQRQSGTTHSESPPASPDTPTTVPTEGSPAPELSGRWPKVYADEANTGTVDHEGPRGTPSIRWRGHVNLETGTWVSEGPDGPVAVQENGLVVAYDSEGTRRWQKRHSGEFVAAPVVSADGTVVVGSRDGTIVAYEADGTRRWRRTTMDGIYAPHANDATPFRLAGDVVLLAHPHGEAMAFDLENGTRRWSVNVPRRSHRPVVDGDRLFLIGNGDDQRESVVQALALADGSTVWSIDLDQSVRIGLGLGDGTLYHGSLDGLLVARSVSDGNEQWTIQLPDDPWISTVPQVFGGQIWVGTLSGGLFAVTEAGVQTHLDIGNTTTPAVGDGRLYVGSTEFGRSWGSDGRVYAFDTDGTELWRTETRGWPNAHVVYRDGAVVSATESGVIDAFDAETGRRKWRAYERPDQLPSPVVGDGAVYCGSYRNWVNGFQASDGTSHLWGVSFDDNSPAAPVVAGQTVLTGSRSGEVAGMPTHEYADPPTNRLTATPTTGPTETEIHIDAPLPEPRWQISLDGPVGDFGYGDDGAYLGSGESVVALTANGDIRWETDVGGRVREAPAALDGTVYAVTTGGTLRALSAVGGDELWRQSVGKTATAPAIAQVEGEPAVVVGTERAVVAVAADSGKEVWRTETGHVRGSPAITADLAVAGDGAGVLRGFVLDHGTERWRVETGGAIHGAPAVGGGVAYVGSRDRRLYAVAVADGSVEWKLELGDWIDGSPAIGYGAVFVMDQSGKISAIHGNQ